MADPWKYVVDRDVNLSKTCCYFLASLAVLVPGLVFTLRVAAGLSNWFCPASGVCHKLLPDELEPLAISKHEVSDDIHCIVACMYLVEQ